MTVTALRSEKKTKNASPRIFSATAKTFCFLHNLDVKIKVIYFVMGMVCVALYQV